MPGSPYDRWWRREGKDPRRFRYVTAQGAAIASPSTLERIRKLRIPPAWTDVRIAPSPRGKLQAIGIDAKGRKQYVYHTDWVHQQAEQKYHKLVAFARHLPHFREVTSRELATPGVGREKVLALVTRLINEGCFRVGGERYAKENKSFGIATLCVRHLEIGKTYLRFSFRGKHGVQHQKVIPDRDLIELMRDVSGLPGKRLFQYRRDDGAVVQVKCQEINAYIKEVMGHDFSAKDFRTWGGTLMAARILAAYGPADTAKERKRREVATVKAVAHYLGNTPAIARASYISPMVFACYEHGITLQDFAPRRRQMVRLMQAGYTPEEVELMKMLSIDVATLDQPGLTVTFAPEAAQRPTA